MASVFPTVITCRELVTSAHSYYPESIFASHDYLQNKEEQATIKVTAF